MRLYIEMGIAVADFSTCFMETIRAELRDVEVIPQEHPDAASSAKASTKGGEEEEEEKQMQPNPELTEISLDLKTAIFCAGLIVSMGPCCRSLKTEASGEANACPKAPYM
jgi:hypothetical protein